MCLRVKTSSIHCHDVTKLDFSNAIIFNSCVQPPEKHGISLQ
jgi:hypothetical protein